MRLLITLLVVILTSFFVNAQEIPQKISYQGKLLQNGERVNGQKTITFTISSWSETHQNVQVNEGLYSVTLGENNPLPTNLFNNSSNLKLEIKVDGSNLSPKTDLLSVPYSYKAQKAVKAKNTFSGDYTDLINTPSFANVATSGDYKNIINTPNFSGWDKDVSDDFSGNWSDLNNKPNFDNVATSGDYNDLSNTPNFSGWDKDASDDLSFPLSYKASLNNDAVLLRATGSSSYDLLDLDLQSSSNGTAININQGGSSKSIDIFHTGDDNAIKLDYSGTNNIVKYNLNNSNTYPFWINSYTKQNSLYITENYSTSNTYPTVWIESDGSDNALYVKGNFTVTGNKNFAHQHPKDTAKQIVYSAKEGPEAGTYYRDKAQLKNGKVVIELPKHFQYVTSSKNLTVQLTPAGNCNGLYVKEVSKKKLAVKELKGGNSNVSFYYQVNGIRKGFEDKEVIQPKAKSQNSD